MTVEDVVLELDNSNDESGDSSGESDDDFEGYLDENASEDESSSDEDLSDDEEEHSSDEMEDIPSIPTYTLSPGVSIDISDSSPLNLFSLFIDSHMLEHIVQHTKLYAEQYMASKTMGPHSRIRQWLKQEHTVPELQQFIALVLIMGLVRYPQIESHWSTSWPYVTDTFSDVSF